MSDQIPYSTLGVNEASSFDEIQEARNRLMEEHEGDRKQIEVIEAAYDAILMERLRLRQEGKIKVPDRIRFPERSEAAPAPKATPAPAEAASGWFQGLLDTPSRDDVLWPALAFGSLGALGFFYAPAALAVGVGFNLYFLNRKERKFGRALLLTAISLVLGVVVGIQLGGLLIPQGAAVALNSEAAAAAFTCFLFWLTSSFLK